MYQAIADAIHAQDFGKAEDLLAVVATDGAENPWVGYYQARLAEEKGELNPAEQQFRQLLTLASNPKLLAKIRASLKRIHDRHQAETQKSLADRQAAIEEAKAAPDAQIPGIFVLEAIAADAKQASAVQFGKIMKLDAYTARLQLPSRAWRLYRTGGMGELTYYQQQCHQAHIPSFCVPIQQILDVKVLPVFYIETLTPNITVSYRINREEQGIFNFNWQDVSQRVEGLLPIFEECVDVDIHGKIQRKTTILDYAKICDLHLPKSQIILRFCDQIYEFSQGISLTATKPNQKSTSHEQWQQLSQIFQNQLLNQPVWKDFKAFAETALDFQELLKSIDPHIHFMRREETPWDQAFHLYSSLAFCRPIPD
ncbi:MAG: hypothetical protein RLZZ490_1211 [Cyanobacteriota bacterium]